MGLFRSLFKALSAPTLKTDSQSAQQGVQMAFGDPRLALSSDIYKQAFDQVMNPVILDGNIKKALWHALKSVDKDEPRKQEEVFTQHLADIEFKWPWFEQFNEIFSKTGEFPYMWKKYKLDSPPGDTEQTIADIIRLFTVKDIKQALSDAEVEIPEKIKRDQLEILATERLTKEQIIISCPERWEKMSQYADNKNNNICKLMVHTISLKSYHIRTYTRLSTSKTMTKRGIVIDKTGCPVEEKYAALWRAGKLDGLPPFFPGDRNGIRGKLHREK